MKLLEELCQAPGIPGREQAIIDIMTRELKKTTDSVSVDSFGNVIGIKKSKKKNAPSIMICGHMDEIGFVVSHIDEKGFIYFNPRGGHVPKVLISQRVTIIGKKETYTGIVEGTPAFLEAKNRKEVPELNEMYIDTGVSVKKLKKDIELGDPIIMKGEFIEQGDVVISKAFDNRIGCYMVIEAMKKLQKKNVAFDIYAVGTAQEEVGIRGAMGAAKNLNPDFGIALDITIALDVPGVPPQRQVCRLGDGVAIKINDSASISNHGIVEFMKKLASKHKIKHQMEILPFGGTDAAGMQRFGGGAVCTLSIPTRYGHSPYEMINKKDLTASINLLAKFLEFGHTCKLAF